MSILDKIKSDIETNRKKEKHKEKELDKYKQRLEKIKKEILDLQKQRIIKENELLAIQLTRRQLSMSDLLEIINNKELIDLYKSGEQKKYTNGEHNNG